MNTETNGVIGIKGAVSALEAQIMESLRSSRSVPESQTARDALDGLDDETAAWKMVIAEAQSQIAAIKSRQNELLPIYRLPGEVLSLILFMALPLKGYHEARTKLLLVCRAWFSIIDENPSTFWTTLSAEDPLTQRARLLRKAGQMPITIVTGSRYAGYDASEDFVKYIKSNDIPFHELIVREWSDKVMEAVFANCLAAPAPQLRSLHVEVRRWWVLGGEDPNSQHRRMFSGVAPSLKNVRLHGVSIPWNSAILQNLLSLTLESPSYRAAGSPSLEQMLGILRSCPALQSLILRDMDFERSNQVQFPPVSLDRLTTINLSMSSFQSILSLLRHIQFPKTATVALAKEPPASQDDDDEILNATLYLLQQHLSIKSFHLAIDESVVRLSTTRLKFSIRDRRWGEHSSYYKELSGLGSPTRAAITSLRMDFPASDDSSAPLDAVNEIIAKLTDLSVDPPHLPKSEKPSSWILEEVVQTPTDIGQPTWVCPNLRSLEITVPDPNSLDLTAIVKLVRTRSSDIESSGKQVTKSPITTIRLALKSGCLSSGQKDLLNELRSEVSDVQCVSLPETDEGQSGDDAESDLLPPSSPVSDYSNGYTTNCWGLD
ncbi:hypothetical protein FRC04_001767 [Tulasnella sp. 424]|nr:hypothetical protein FRC04_001767 [Tulasnella sp. 424]KAG8968162.1 hypothetical protein FRC05_001639 [Tulasnella sp. 425]